jgi:hypothetical protein
MYGVIIHESDKNVNLDKYWDIHLFYDDMPYIYEFIPGYHFCITKSKYY